LNKRTYLNYLQNRYGVEAEGGLTDFLSRRDGRLLLADQIDLQAMIAHYGAPLEIAYCPLISEQIERMQGWAAEARASASYTGAFLYAYATKANFAEEVVRTAITSGAHYETSATADVLIAHHLWRQGILPEEPLYLLQWFEGAQLHRRDRDAARGRVRQHRPHPRRP